MGYYTRFDLVAVEGCDRETFIAALRNNEYFDGSEPFDDSSKWYEHEDDICRAMRDTGATLVEIHGEGEEQGDVWDKRFTLVDEAGRRIEIKKRKQRSVMEDWS